MRVIDSGQPMGQAVDECGNLTCWKASHSQAKFPCPAEVPLLRRPGTFRLGRLRSRARFVGYKLFQPASARVDTVENEAREDRRAASENRRKITEMTAEPRSASGGVSRIEGLLDRMMMERTPEPP